MERLFNEACDPKQLSPLTLAFVGDAAERFQNKILEYRPDSLFLPQQFSLQRASSVCAVAARLYGQGALLRYDELEPHYLRESQAERLKKR